MPSPEEIFAAIAALAQATARSPETQAGAAAARQATQGALAAKYRKEAEEAEEKKKKSGLFGSGGSLVGSIVGTALGGPLGGIAGGAIGGAGGAAAGGSEDFIKDLAGYGASSAVGAGLGFVGGKAVGALKNLGQTAGTATKTTADAATKTVTEGAVKGGTEAGKQVAQATVTPGAAPPMLVPSEPLTDGPFRPPTFLENLKQGFLDKGLVSAQGLAETFSSYSPTVATPKAPAYLDPETVAAINSEFRQSRLDQEAAQFRQAQLGLDRSRLGLEGERVGLEGRRVDQGDARLQLEEQELGLREKQTNAYIDTQTQQLATEKLKTLSQELALKGEQEFAAKYGADALAELKYKQDQVSYEAQQIQNDLSKKERDSYIAPGDMPFVVSPGASVTTPNRFNNANQGLPDVNFQGGGGPFTQAPGREASNGNVTTPGGISLPQKDYDEAVAFLQIVAEDPDTYGGPAKTDDINGPTMFEDRFSKLSYQQQLVVREMMKASGALVPKSSQAVEADPQKPRKIVFDPSGVLVEIGLE